MPDRAYVYIDGESHFIRSEKAWQGIHGENASLTQLRYVGFPDDQLVLVDPKAKVFWTRKMNPGANRTIYFTSVVGDEDAVFRLELKLKRFDLESHVIHERQDSAAQRNNVLNQQGVIEKPKTLDVALAVRMLTDAFSTYRKFDVCHLYTSDVDYEPLIKAVMAQGMNVIVHGYRKGLSGRSPLLTVPDKFYDLEDMLKNECELAPPQAQGD